MNSAGRILILFPADQGIVTQKEKKRYRKIRKRPQTPQTPSLTKKIYSRGRAQGNGACPCCGLDHTCMSVWCRDRAKGDLQICRCTEGVMTK